MSSFIAHFRSTDHTEQSVSEHLQNVSRLAALHASKIGLAPAGELIGLLHDFGKYSGIFQNYLKSAEGIVDADADEFVDAHEFKGKIDHSTAGAQYVWRQLSQTGGVGLYAGQMLALCIASHHSGLIDCLSGAAANFGEDIFTRRMQKAVAKTHLDEVIQVADAGVLARAAELLGDPRLPDCIKLLASRIVAANRNRTIPMQQQLGLMVRFLFSCLIDAD
ncbi:MAG: CRISPR-associated endonuclease Cas3'', partial [Acidobacteriaceae bacterium]|nr:CRISPR-associated endonuclease Cas3'' [Acidobacteriaceae bacterium]